MVSKRSQPHVRSGSIRPAYLIALLFVASAAGGYGMTRYLIPDVAFSRDTPPSSERVTKPPRPKLDMAAYDRAVLRNANLPPDLAKSATSSAVTHKPWPVQAPYPLGGALLPFNRIVAYYGNYLSTQMGVLGEYEHDTMIAKLRATVKEWEAADPATPVIPAIDYIAITAQGSAGRDGMYRLRMPDEEIEHALRDAKEVGGIVILDIQVGKSTLAQELPLLDPYLKLPQVHLAIDPEFAMKTSAPGTVIGYFTAADVNYAAKFLAALVKEHDLPPKILLVHRFTQDMVRGAADITPLPEVQIVMDMDGWGEKAKKLTTYEKVIREEPVQFTGFKLFYKNDIKPPSTGMMTPAEVLRLSPQPVFIQYQ
jgi:hypothetical protein